MAGLPTARLVFSGPRLMGFLGDVEIAGWPANTPIHYHNANLIGNTFFTYSAQDVQNVFKNSGIFVPNTVIVQMVDNGVFSESRYIIDITGVLSRDYNTADLQTDIEGYLANFFVTSPATAVYSPPPTISQTVSNTGSVVRTNSNPVSTASDDPLAGWSPVSDPTAYGVQTVLTNYTDQYSDFDVIFTDGTSGVFDSEGNYDSGTRGSVVSVQELLDDYDNVIGAVAYLNNSTELYFDMAGNFNGGYTPSGAVSTVPTRSNPLSTVNSVTPDALAAAIKNALGGGTPGQPGKPLVDSQKILDSLGLGNIGLALGVGAGTVLIGGGFILYLLVTGTLAGKGRR